MNIREHRGVTLIELMIGMTIGLLVLGAITSVYLSSRQTARTNDVLARMQESGRYALDLLTSHATHAGYFGVVISPANILGSATAGSTLNSGFRPADDCAIDWYVNIAIPLRAYDGTASGSQQFAGTCLADVANSREYLPNTDILEIRNADPIDLGDNPPAGTFQPGHLYVRADFASGMLFEGSQAPPAPSGFSAARETHEIGSTLYHIANHDPEGGGDFTPYLMRTRTQEVAGNIEVNTQALYPGIEQMQIELGIDTDGDCDVDFWQPPGVAANTSLVTALRIWLLVRAEREESAGYLNTRTYTLGNYNYDPPDDRFRRMPMVRTMKLRNMNASRPPLNNAAGVDCQ